MNGFTLSREQIKAATSSSDHLLIVAPPGCGKTEVLAHRAKYLIDSLEKNQYVLALTFTNRARSNLEERLRAVLGRARARRYIVVRNFHGFAAEIVLAHGRTIGLDMSNLQLPKTSTLREAMEKAGGSRETMYAAERMLSDIKRCSFSDPEVLEELQKKTPEAVRQLAEKVEQTRQKEKQLHYDDLLRHAQYLLQIPAIARLYQAHFGAVLVDEFQDLSLQQLDLAQLSCTARQTFAGDQLQGIYSWAGATPAEVAAKIFEQSQVIRLHESYRSSPKVLSTVNSISEKIDPEARLISAKPDLWPGGGCSASIEFSDPMHEAQTLRDLTAEILERDPEASVGIICRSGWRRKCIDQAFSAEERFPVQRWDLAIEDSKNLALIRAAVSALPKGASIDEARVATLSSVDPADVETREQLDVVFDVLLELSDTSTAREAIRTIRTSGSKQNICSGAHLLSAHTGKGQQFDWVFVVGLEEGHLPDRRNTQGEALEEERRVLLVMLSRARHGLVVTRSLTNNGRYGSYPVPESRWWAELQTDVKSIEELKAYLEEL